MTYLITFTSLRGRIECNFNQAGKSFFVPSSRLIQPFFNLWMYEHSTTDCLYHRTRGETIKLLKKSKAAKLWYLLRQMLYFGTVDLHQRQPIFVTLCYTLISRVNDHTIFFDFVLGHIWFAWILQGPYMSLYIYKDHIWFPRNHTGIIQKNSKTKNCIVLIIHWSWKNFMDIIQGHIWHIIYWLVPQVPV